MAAMETGEGRGGLRGRGRYRAGGRTRGVAGRVQGGFADGPAPVELGAGSNRKLPPGEVPCVFFQEGRCKYGNDCRYSHTSVMATTSTSGVGSNGHAGPAGKRTWGRQITTGTSKPSSKKIRPPAGREIKQALCFHWAKGSCTKGDTCQYQHTFSTAPDVQKVADLVGHEQVGHPASSKVADAGAKAVGQRAPRPL
eukprot:jgi/Mesvir1/26801/Mv25909-RA.1